MVFKVDRTSNLVAYDLMPHDLILSRRTLAAEAGTRIVYPDQVSKMVSRL